MNLLPASSPVGLWLSFGLWTSLLGGSCGKGATPPERPAQPATPAGAAEEVILGDLQALGFEWHPLLHTEQRVGADVFAPAGMGSQAIDGSTLLGGAWLISHLERPEGGIWRTRLSADLVPVETAPIDLRVLQGGYIHCAASVTPWGSHLGSEEYEPDAAIVGSDQRMAKTADRGRATPEEPLETVPDHGYNEIEPRSPYDYGWMFEIEPVSFGVIPHPTLGRFSHELGLVLEDRRTVYLTDDTYLPSDAGVQVGGGGLFRFVADRPDDLSAGELFAAILEQGQISWISLGHASDAELSARPSFSELFDRVIAAECPAGFTRTETMTGRECLRVRPGQDRLASRLETRRYAALLGATTWLTKSEGLTLDGDTLYLVLSSVKAPMKGKPHGLPEPDAGLVLALALDDQGVATAYRVEVGEGVNNADNITFVPGVGLFIAEDTTKNDDRRSRLWLWRQGALEWVASSPVDMEVAGLSVGTLHGQRYLTVAFQGDKSSSTGLFGPL